MGDEMMKKILKILGVIILLLAITLFAVIIYLGRHPEIALRIVSQPIKEEQVNEVDGTVVFAAFDLLCHRWGIIVWKGGGWWIRY